MNPSEPVVPSNFRGLRILLLDGDTPSLLDIASQLENLSYIVTSTELPTIALSILQERPNSFDLIMAEIDLPEMNCLEFIKSVHLIKDLPIILMSAEASRSVIEEAIMKGASFFLRKPISHKNLVSVWQHFYKDILRKNARNNGGDQEARAEEQVNAIEIIEISDEEVGDSDDALSDRGGPVDETELAKSKRAGKKRAMPPPGNDEPGEIKRVKTENEGGMISQMKMDFAKEFASSSRSNESKAKIKKVLKRSTSI